ncbi:MAG: flagellin FliC, partial [Burkholderiales bacterium]|nr:flagellin FliC [Burkholderiales bacterium]
KEFGQLQSEITRVLGGTAFNGKHILGADATTLNFQVGANTTSDDTVSITTTDMATSDTTMTTVTNTSTAVIDSTATSGAIAKSSVENQTAARSRIMDADFATETANMSRANVLQQAGTAMIAQANQQPSQVLSLLR